MLENFFDWVDSSLNRKFIAGTAVGLVAFSIIFLVLFVGMYRGQLEQGKAQAADQVNRLLQTSLEAAMLRRDLDMLRSIISQMGDQKDVEGVSIINRTGEIRFSNQSALLGGKVLFDCDTCEFDPARSTTAFSFFTRNDEGRSVLRTIHPVLNREACSECHGPKSANPVNGTLVVDYDSTSIQKQAGQTTLVLMGAGSTIVFINLIGGWWFMRRFVLRPIQHLKETSEALANGDLHSRTRLSSRDEIAQLGRRFNHMAENLEENLREIKRKESFLQALVNADPDGLRVIDGSYNVLLANQAYCETLGLSPDQVLGKPCYASSHGRDQPCIPTLVNCPLKEIGSDQSSLKTMQEFVTHEGCRMAVEVVAAPMRIQEDNPGPDAAPLIVESIRDLEKTIKISHEQKLSEIGRLAAGVAHEIHNPLGSVRLAMDSVLRSDTRKDPISGNVKDCLILVDREITRCLDVTDRLLKMSMFQGVETQVVSVNQAIDETLSLLTWEAAEDKVETVCQLDSSDPRILANESDIRIIVLNLIQNAFHAMPDGGTLTITTRTVDNQVEVRVQDTGVGILPSDINQIFDPFFSRRADSVPGTGLGLSIAKALVKKYSGSLSVSSIPREGSLFSIGFPRPDVD